MEVQIRRVGDNIVIVLLIDAENKVTVKYFRNSEEVKEWNSLSFNDRLSIERETDNFFNNNSHLIMWSY